MGSDPEATPDAAVPAAGALPGHDDGTLPNGTVSPGDSGSPQLGVVGTTISLSDEDFARLHGYTLKRDQVVQTIGQTAMLLFAQIQQGNILTGDLQREQEKLGEIVIRTAGYDPGGDAIWKFEIADRCIRRIK